MTKNQALSLRSQWLGERLRKARTRAGYSQDEAGAYLHLEGASISRFERGTHPIRPSYVRDLIAFYGISHARERDALLRLHEDAWRKDWWEGDTSDLMTEFIDYTWLEARAAKICDYEPMLIPGLLQTTAYARAVMKKGNYDEDTVDRMVELRQTRQRILSGNDPTALSVVVEDAVLRRPTGGVNVLREQLAHLLEMAAKPHIEVQVLPITIEWNPGHTGPFTYFEMPDPYPEVAYIESLVGRTFFEDPAKVARYREAYQDLSRTALTPAKSTRLIRSVLEEMR